MKLALATFTDYASGKKLGGIIVLEAIFKVKNQDNEEIPREQQRLITSTFNDRARLRCPRKKKGAVVDLPLLCTGGVHTLVTSGTDC